MNDAPRWPESMKGWLDETLQIAQHPIYVSDMGIISCADDDCTCAGNVIGYEMAGRRHTLQCVVEAIAIHREHWGPGMLPGVHAVPPSECLCCHRTAARRNGQ